MIRHTHWLWFLFIFLPLTTQAAPSLYEFQMAFKNQTGVSVDWSTLRGHPVIMSMVYASCPYTCPQIVSNIQRVEARLSPELRSKVRVLLVSIDPEHDTPKQMQEALVRHHADESRWTFVKSSAEKTRELAALLNVNYRTLPSGDLNHSAILVLLDAQGTIVGTFEGATPPIDDIAEKLKMLSGAPSH